MAKQVKARLAQSIFRVGSATPQVRGKSRRSTLDRWRRRSDDWRVVAVPILFFVAAAVGAACTIPNTKHCGRNQGSQTCAERYEDFVYCSICESERDGCVAMPVNDPSCRPNLVETDAGSSDTIDPSTGVTTDQTTEPDPTTTDGSASESETADTTLSETETETATETETETDTDTDTETDSDTGAPMCGDGQLDNGENCDGEDLNGKICADFDHGGGELQCNDMCEFDISNCCKLAGESCAQLSDSCCDGLSCNLLTGICG